MQRLLSCLIGFTFHEIKINDLPESSNDHTSISTHLKEWCDLLRIFLHPLPYFPCKINKEIHYNFFRKSKFYQDQSGTLKETGPRIKQETQQYYQQDQRTNELHVNGNRSSRYQRSCHQEVGSPPTNSPPSNQTSWWRDDRKPCQQRQSKKTNNDIEDKFNRGHN